MRIIYTLFTLVFFSTATAQVNLQLLGNLSFGNVTCAGVRAYTDPNNNEYALIGAGNGIAIVDVTDPANPNLLL